MMQDHEMDHALDAENDFDTRLAMGLAPIFEGLLLFPLGLINPFWSSVFGLGGHGVEWIAPPHGVGIIDLFGILVWPIIVLTLLHRFNGWLLRLSGPVHTIALGLYGLSLCLIVPSTGILSGPFKYEWLPLYIRLLAW